MPSSIFYPVARLLLMPNGDKHDSRRNRERDGGNSSPVPVAQPGSPPRNTNPEPEAVGALDEVGELRAVVPFAVADEAEAGRLGDLVPGEEAPESVGGEREQERLPPVGDVDHALTIHTSVRLEIETSGGSVMRALIVLPLPRGMPSRSQQCAQRGRPIRERKPGTQNSPLAPQSARPSPMHSISHSPPTQRISTTRCRRFHDGSTSQS